MGKHDDEVLEMEELINWAAPSLILNYEGKKVILLKTESRCCVRGIGLIYMYSTLARPQQILE